MDGTKTGIKVDVSIPGKKEEIMYRVASCSGVKTVSMHLIMWYQYQLKDHACIHAVSTTYGCKLIKSIMITLCSTSRVARCARAYIRMSSGKGNTCPTSPFLSA